MTMLQNALSAEHAILSSAGAHAGQGWQQIITRKRADIASTNHSVWVVNSNATRPGAVQSFCGDHDARYVIFVSRFRPDPNSKSASGTSTSDRARGYSSDDGKTWSPLDKGLSEVTGCERPSRGRPAQDSYSGRQQGHPSSCLRLPGNQSGQRLKPTVNVHFYSGFRDPASVCCFGDALSVQFYGLDGASHFSGSRCISRFRSYELSASTLSSCAMIASASSIGTSEIDARLRRRKSISL
jgi:hypothetical protein